MMILDVVIGILNPVMSAIFAVSLYFLWRHDRQHTYIAILVASYTVRTLCFIVLYFSLPHDTMALRLLANVLILLAATLVAVALAVRMGRAPGYGVLLAINLLTMLGWWLSVDAGRGLQERGIVVNLGIAAICAVMLRHVHGRTSRTPVEQLLYFQIWMALLLFLARPFIIMASGSAGDEYPLFYWVFTSVSDVIIASTLAVAIFALIASDVVGKMRSDALTDVLTGLLNRRGFEQQANAALNGGARGRVAAMIMGDLDHFKQINDRHGHGRGDRVIRLFAEKLREHAPPGTIIGRLGGEEFVALVMRDGIPPHVFAEQVRAAFSADAAGAFADGMRSTASIGIAAVKDGEDYPGLLERADAALYQAKAAGRDCIWPASEHHLSG